MSERIDAPVELTDAELAMVAGGDNGVEFMLSAGAAVLLGGGTGLLNRDANNGFNNSHFGDGAEFFPPA